MRFKRNGALLILVALLLAVVYGIYRSDPLDATPPPASARRALADRSVVVDQGSLVTAEQLVRMPTTPDERSFAEEALRLADQEMDLAFAQAVRVTASKARAASPEVKALGVRVEAAQRALASDQALVKGLTAPVVGVKATNAQALADRIQLAQAQIALDQDEVDDATQDLRRAGGDPQGRMQAMIADHEAASRRSDTIRVNTSPAQQTHGLVNHVRALLALHQKRRALAQATAVSDSLADAFKRRHDRLTARAAAGLQDAGATALSHDSAAVLLAAAQRRALTEKARTSLDQRIDIQRRLADVYTAWAAVVGSQERAVINLALKSIAVILFIILVATLLARWIEHVLSAVTTMDRRRLQTLSMVTRVSLRVAAVLVILLVLFGPPANIGTVVGLAGAGLTVALKDFIIGFIGWFVLMGRNGIGIGDLVEINGVTGEVVGLGMFRTVLLEMGGWKESGNPTGRRVSFMNGFAIEGHYFNFSTAGRWLWDEVRFVVPAGRDPNPIVAALQAQIEETRAESARQAEADVKVARQAPHLDPRTFAPTINLRPIAGGVEIVARYITDVAERGDLKAKLYHTAVEMLAGVVPPPNVAGANGPAPGARVPALQPSTVAVTESLAPSR